MGMKVMNIRYLDLAGLLKLHSFTNFRGIYGLEAENETLPKKRGFLT
jgi:hypothetical protein